MPARLAIVTAALALSAAAAFAAWSPEATLGGCGPARAPKVVFPSSSPSTPSGRGAIMWLGCGVLQAATLHSDDQPSVVRRVVVGEGLRAPFAAAGTTAGQLVAAVKQRSGGALLAEGSAGGRLALAQRFGASVGPIAAANGWIGDADVAYVTHRAGAEAIELLEQRHYSHSFGHPLTLAEGSAPITSLFVALDFRADSIVLWTAEGSLHGQFVSNSGVAGPAQVIGPAGAITQLSAVLSDNGRAFVTWSAEPARGVAGQTTVYLVHSAANVTFGGRPRVVASFAEPPGLRLGPHSLALVRMTPSEGVLAAWTLLSNGAYVVQAAGLTSSHILPPYTVSEPGTDLRLAAIAPGPRNDAAIVLARAPRGVAGWNLAQQSLLAARSVPGGPGGVAFESPVQIASAGSNSEPSIAFDPHSDAAVVAWQADGGRIAYAVRSGS
ncbi:MAG TPA: hypothetical protein VHX66_11790 [Solirubrobacteraceae bacterium]|nr:hypothetical protein [Solirubrobacteraceae bacterium]